MIQLTKLNHLAAPLKHPAGDSVIVRYEPPDELVQSAAFEALGPDLRGVVMIIAEGCYHRRPDGGIYGAGGAYVQQRAAILGVPLMACWCGLVLLTIDGFVQADEIIGPDTAPIGVRLGLPVRRLPPVSPRALLERCLSLPLSAEATLRHACLAVELDGYDHRVREAMLFGLLGVLNRV